MAVYVSEFAGAAYASGKVLSANVPQEPQITTTVFSSAVTSTATLNGATRLVRLYASANAWVLFTTSSSSTTVATSTNAEPIVAGAPAEFRGVKAGSRFTVLST
jgi:hypothetical protein